MPTRAEIVDSMIDFLDAELGNQMSMESEALLKGEEIPDEATMTTALFSLLQMPDDILTEITGMDATQFQIIFLDLCMTIGNENLIEVRQAFEKASRD